MTIQSIPSGTGVNPSPTTQSATANINSEVIDTEYMGLRVGTLSMQVNATSFNASDATVKVQHSNDKTNWVDITDGSLTIASGTSTQILAPVVYLSARYHRVVYTKNSNSAGTIQVICNLI